MEKFAEYLRNTITDKMTLKEIVDIFENACQLMNEWMWLLRKELLNLFLQKP